MGNKTFTCNEATKPSRLKDHLSTKHSDKVNNQLGYFQNLKAKADKRPKVSKLFKSQATDLDKGFLASYNMSLLIAKCI